MATTGVFTLITNTGIQDKMIMQTDQLHNYLQHLSRNKLSELRQYYPGLTDQEISQKDKSWMPSIELIEKSHILFVSNTFKPYVSIAKEYSKTISYGGIPNLGQSFSMRLPIVGDFICDGVIHLRLTGLEALNVNDRVKYVDYLGHRILKNTVFKSQNMEIDSYGPDEYNAHYQHFIKIDRREAYLRSIGQELPIQCYLTHNVDLDNHKELKHILDGPQTYKSKHGDIDIWMPLLFWFTDPKQSLPNFILPSMQSEIEFTLASETDILAIAGIGQVAGAYIVPKISKCDMYMNHLYILPEVLKLYHSRFSLQLIRVHRRHNVTLTVPRGDVLLHNLKWPVEMMNIGFRPKVNLLYPNRWHKYTHIDRKIIQFLVAVSDDDLLTNNPIAQSSGAEYFKEYHVVSSVGLRSMDIEIFPSLPPDFYNNYVPYTYAGQKMTSPALGWLMFNFNLTPGEFQPSGYLNTSQKRELYLNYVSDNTLVNNVITPIIRVDNPVDLIVLATCLNFILYEGGSMMLKFST